MDFGQVLAGRPRFRVQAPEGTEIKLEHGEVLDREGNFVANVLARNRDQTDFYVCRGEGVEEYEPSFAFHGFRYVRVAGWPGTPSVFDFSATVLSSDLEVVGGFSCSDSRLERLQQNILWSTIGNTIGIPTDCPQRERMGWTGDVQVFAPTMTYLLDSAAFLSRWLAQLRAEQGPDGRVPCMAPLPKGEGGPVALPEGGTVAAGASSRRTTAR